MKEDWITLGRPMKAHELAEILMRNPDDYVCVPIPEYSAYETATMAIRDDLYQERGQSSVSLLSQFFSGVPDPKRFECIGKSIVICGDS